MIVNNNPRIWEFDVDDTLILWDKSKYTETPKLFYHKDKTITLQPNWKNINMLIKLSKIGWYIRVHSGSGVEWAETILKQLDLTEYVDIVEAKPLGKTDDKPPGEGLAYIAYRTLEGTEK